MGGILNFLNIPEDRFLESHPVAALLISVCWPLVVLFIGCVGIYLAFNFLVRVLGVRESVDSAFSAVRFELGNYISFITQNRRVSIAYAVILLILSLLLNNNFVIKDSLIFASGTVLTAEFLYKFSGMGPFKNPWIIAVFYGCYLIVAVSPFIVEWNRPDIVAFNRWYSYTIVFFPIATSGLWLAIKGRRTD